VEKPGLQPVGAGPGDGPPVWHRINGVLDSLERYGHALGDQGRSLKEIEPLAQELEQRVEDLQAGLPDDGHPLRQLAGEVLAQAQVAALKYRRGDYL
jgi:ABC-type Fe3+-hydroxamate transport system substrate-binding protein